MSWFWLFLLQQFETGNRWIRTRIEYQPCITSEPTNCAILTCNFIKKETLVQVFSFEFCEISKNTWWLNLFYTSLFSIKVIFERVVTSIFYIICYISVFNIAKECLFCFSNMSNAVVPLLFICFSISLLVFLNVSLFVRRDRFMISLVIVLLMKGAWFALTDLFFFKGTFFFRVTSLVFF